MKLRTIFALQTKMMFTDDNPCSKTFIIDYSDEKIFSSILSTIKGVVKDASPFFITCPSPSGYSGLARGRSDRPVRVQRVL